MDKGKNNSNFFTEVENERVAIGDDFLKVCESITYKNTIIVV